MRIGPGEAGLTDIVSANPARIRILESLGFSPADRRLHAFRRRGTVMHLFDCQLRLRSKKKGLPEGHARYRSFVQFLERRHSASAPCRRSFCIFAYSGEHLISPRKM